jgi:hypothetical protein
MPAISVWPDSSSGLDAEGRILLGEALERDASLSWSAFVLGSIATLDHRSGNVIDSRMTG